jgi:transcriptional regulator GlxA family with amidase domain
MSAALPTIAILALPESGASVVYGMYDLFKSAGRDWDLMVTGTAGPPLMNPIVVARRTGTFDIANNVRLTPHDSFENVHAPDIVCVPEVFLAPGDAIDGRFTPEIAWLRRCHAQGAILASACSGALLLAEAGLLDGEEATTHWAFCETLQARHPSIKMRPRNALVASGEGQRLVMAGGGASWFDLALYLIARIAGVEVAMQTARVNLIDWHAAGQQPYAHLARARQSEDALIADCQVWIAENYHGGSPVTEMIRRSGLAERTFNRRFQKATGLSPLEYVHTLRLEEAKQMLEAGLEPVEAVAEAVGYQDPGFFSRLFKRKVGLSPLHYRRRFGEMRRRLQSGRPGG